MSSSDGMQLPLADLERQYECGAGCKCGCFSRDVKATLQLPAVALAAAHGDAQWLHVQAAAGLLLMASEAGARADARIAGVESGQEAEGWGSIERFAGGRHCCQGWKAPKGGGGGGSSPEMMIVGFIAVTFESKSCNNKLSLDSVTRPLHSPDGPKPPCNDSARQRK